LNKPHRLEERGDVASKDIGGRNTVWWRPDVETSTEAPAQPQRGAVETGARSVDERSFSFIGVRPANTFRPLQDKFQEAVRAPQVRPVLDAAPVTWRAVATPIHAGASRYPSI
jgi:hypothetical protein